MTSVSSRRKPLLKSQTPIGKSKELLAISTKWLILAGFALFSLVPMTWMLLAPSKTQPQLQQNPPLSFGTFEGYITAWNNLALFQDSRILQWLWNSIWYSTLQVVVATIVAILAGYALAATKMPLQRPMLIITLIAMIVPAVAFVLPIFVQVSQLGLYNTAWAIILPGMFYPFGVFLAYIYFSSTIPKELYEAAKVDGAGEWGTLLRIVLPMSWGLVGMLAFFSFQANWVNFFLPYMVVNSGEILTLPVGMGILFSQTPALNPGVGAVALPIRGPEIALAGLIVTLPILIVFLASSRLLVRGVLAGAVKS
jgi:multiple sugar transport system permease protein